MNVIWLIVMGGVVGWLASLVMKTDAQQGIVANIIIGILGAVVGGWLYGLLFDDTAESVLGRLIVSVLGAVLVIWIWQKLSNNRPTTEA